MPDIPEVHTSERKSFKRCPQQWWWAYRMGLTPKGETADALWFGIGIHHALAEWYLKGKKRGPHPADTFEAWAGNEIREIRESMAGQEWYDEPKFTDARELGVAMLEEYINVYGRDPEWYVISIEQPFKVDIKFQGENIGRFASTFDGVVRYDGEIFLLEHKTAAQISTAYLELDDQAGAYWAVASHILRDQKVLKPDEKIAGIIYNFLRKAKPDDREYNEEGLALNKDGTVSKRQPPPLFVREIIERSPGELESQLLRIGNEVSLMNRIRSGELPLLKNTTRECTWCDFFDICKLHERGGEAWQELAKATMIQRNPYERDPVKSASE